MINLQQLLYCFFSSVGSCNFRYFSFNKKKLSCCVNAVNVFSSCNAFCDSHNRLSAFNLMFNTYIPDILIFSMGLLNVSSFIWSYLLFLLIFIVARSSTGRSNFLASRMTSTSSARRQLRCVRGTSNSNAKQQELGWESMRRKRCTCLPETQTIWEAPPSVLVDGDNLEVLKELCYLQRNLEAYCTGE